MKNYLFLILFLVLVKVVQAQNTVSLAAANSFVEKKQAAFEENKGQVWDLDGIPASSVQYHFSKGNMSLFMLPTGIAYQFSKIHYPSGYQLDTKDLTEEERLVQTELSEQIRLETYRMDMELVAANPQAKIVAEGKSKDYVNYYNRNTLQVHSFERLTYKDIYEGIDWVIYTTPEGLKYDFVVHPGADPSQIQLSFKDHERLELNVDGSFALSNSMGTITEQAPISFQGTTEVATKFVQDKNTIRFVLEDYDQSQPLRIDPALVWATYYGASRQDWANSCAIDTNGNLYVTGRTLSTTNIASRGHQNTHGGGRYDVFLVKFDSSGMRQWATYYGGIDEEESFSCATDLNGNVYVVGETESLNNIASRGHQNTHGGGRYDAFLVKFDSSGTRQWATYYGGNSADYGYSCVVEASGDVYLTGWTHSLNNIASGGYQNTHGGMNDAFLVKFNSDGIRQWGTYYGGIYSDEGHSTSVDNNGNVYLAGNTNSRSNIALGGYQNTYGGGAYDAFLVKFNSSGVRQWATYYGGSAVDKGISCAVNASGTVCLAGTTYSTSNVASGGHQNNHAGNITDGYLVKFDPNGVRQWATYYGGSDIDRANACAVDALGYVYLTGSTGSTNNIAFNGHQNTYTGAYDSYLVKFDPNGVRQWATYYGGMDNDYSRSCVLDTRGHVYLAGTTYSTNNIASGGYQNTYGGGSGDAFLAKFITNRCTPTTSTDVQTACNSYTWIDGNTYTASNNTAVVVLTNAVGCDSIITLDLTITTLDLTLTVSGDTLTAGATGASYQWLACDNNYAPIVGATDRSFIPTTSGSYAAIIAENGCMDTTSCMRVRPLSIPTLPTVGTIQVYPNPTTGKLIIDLVQQSEAILTIYTVNGQQLQQKIVQGQGLHELTLEGPKGLYWLQVKSDDQLQHIKLIKQ